jgi:hypothetical protein
MKQLPMLSSCADYTSSSHDFYSSHPPSRSSSVPIFTCLSSPNRMIHSPEQMHRSLLYAHDDPFLLQFQPSNETNHLIKSEHDHLLIDLAHVDVNQDIVISPATISNTSSPSKYRVLNTPERLIQVDASCVCLLNIVNISCLF